jgi:hypothetical protein
MNKQEQDEYTTTMHPQHHPLPPAAHYARALLSMAFGWVFLRGWQLRHDLLATPEQMQMVQFNLLAESGRQLRAPIQEEETPPHAACLFVTNPEVFSLPEWLIHNSFIHPSHHLVFTVDTAATSLPAEMLLAYKQDNDVTLVEWIVSDFVNNEQQERDIISTPTSSRDTPDDKTNFEGQDTQLNHHQLFMEKCALYMQVEHGQDMTVTFHDTDEFANHKEQEQQPRSSSLRTSQV